MSELGVLPAFATAAGTTAHPQVLAPGDVRMDAEGFDVLLKSELVTPPEGAKLDASAITSAGTRGSAASDDADSEGVSDCGASSASAQVSAQIAFLLGDDSNPRGLAIVAAAERSGVAATDDPPAVTTAGSQATHSACMRPRPQDTRTTPNTAPYATSPKLPDAVVPDRVDKSDVSAAEPTAGARADQPQPAVAEGGFRTGQERSVEPEQKDPDIPAQQHGAALQAVRAYASGAAPAMATDQSSSAFGREHLSATSAESRPHSHHAGSPTEVPPDPTPGRHAADIQIRSGEVPNLRESRDEFAMAGGANGASIDTIAEPNSSRLDASDAPMQRSETWPSLSASVDLLISGGEGRVDSPAHAESLRAPPGPGNATGMPVAPSDCRLGSPEWNHEFSSKVTVFVSRRESQAEIQINPPEMGPVKVRISVQGDEVAVAFGAHQPGTRAAIESALPQLRDMLAANGLALGNTSVDTGSAGQQSPQSESRPASSPYVQANSVLADDLTPRMVGLERLVDTYA